MHIHSSFSEQSGSMDSQLHQAASNAVDVVWWTDHDHRMDGLEYRKAVHFTSLTDERGGPGQGGAWDWTPVESGPLARGSAGGIVSRPCSPNDPVAGGSLHLLAKSESGAAATSGYYANCHPAGWNYRDNLTGQSLSIDVLLEPGWSRGYLELLIASSYHQAAGRAPAGDYTLSYRFVPPEAAGGHVANGTKGVVTIPVRPTSREQPWVTVTLTPSQDIAALWPDVDYRDFALWELTLSAVSTGDAVSGYVDYLRFDRQRSGEAFLNQQKGMGRLLQAKYPRVVQQQGLEVSWQLPHINWFGGNVVVPVYPAMPEASWAGYLRNTAIPQIHAAGGLVSYNHPYGYGDIAQLPIARQNAMLAAVARDMLPAGARRAALGADLIEVGYTLRQGVNLAHHLALWDVLSRNAVFLTGNGTSDDHFGTNWAGITNNWITSVWARSPGEPQLLSALAAGRSWCGSLSRFRGTLDLLVDGSCPMGSVSVSAANTRRLVASASGIPPGGSLQVLKGDVDYAGTNGLAANTSVVASYSAADLARGQVTHLLDTARECFARTQVVDAAQAIVGVSNPVWLLRKSPPGGVPGRRAA